MEPSSAPPQPGGWYGALWQAPRLWGMERPGFPPMADFDASSGLRGLCSVLIVLGHFFDGCAPSRFRYAGFDASIDGCDAADARMLSKCYPRNVLGEAYPAITIMYMTPVTLFFVISGALFAYLYYDAFAPTFASATPAITAWLGFLTKRFWRVAPMLWLSLLWHAPFFFGDDGSLYPLSLKLTNLVIAPTPLFVLQPLVMLGMEWNSMTWQVSNLFLCYACVPRLFAALKSTALARARSPRTSDDFQPLTLELPPHNSALLSHLTRVTGYGFWAWWAVSTGLYWLLSYRLCEEAPLAPCPTGQMYAHLGFATRLPQFAMGFYVGLALREEELVMGLLLADGGALAQGDRSQAFAAVELTRIDADGGRAVVAADAALAAYREAVALPERARALLVDILFFGWMAALVAVSGAKGDDGASYDFDAQFWLAPLHCLWLYHAARLPSAGSARSSYAPVVDATVEVGDGTAAGTVSSSSHSLASRFLCSSVMLHLGQLSYGIYVCQLGALYTVMWLHNGFTLPGPATWLNHPVAAYGIWALDTWQLAEVFVLLLSVVQLAEVAFARLGVGGTSRAK